MKDSKIKEPPKIKWFNLIFGIVTIIAFLSLALTLNDLVNERNKVVLGNNYITNMTIKVFINGKFSDQQSKIINVSINRDATNETCYPDIWYDMLLIDFKNSEDVSKGDIVTHYRIFEDIERPNCFDGFQNSKEEIKI